MLAQARIYKTLFFFWLLSQKSFIQSKFVNCSGGKWGFVQFKWFNILPLGLTPSAITSIISTTLTITPSQKQFIISNTITFTIPISLASTKTIVTKRDTAPGMQKTEPFLWKSGYNLNKNCNFHFMYNHITFSHLAATVKDFQHVM